MAWYASNGYTTLTLYELVSDNPLVTVPSSPTCASLSIVSTFVFEL